MNLKLRKFSCASTYRATGCRQAARALAVGRGGGRGAEVRTATAIPRAAIIAKITGRMRGECQPRHDTAFVLSFEFPAPNRITTLCLKCCNDRQLFSTDASNERLGEKRHTLRQGQGFRVAIIGT